MIDIDKFASRHIGPRNEDIIEMLKVVGSKSLDDLIEKTVPDHIIFKDDHNTQIDKNCLFVGVKMTGVFT